MAKKNAKPEVFEEEVEVDLAEDLDKVDSVNAQGEEETPPSVPPNAAALKGGSEDDPPAEEVSTEFETTSTTVVDVDPSVADKFATDETEPEKAISKTRGVYMVALGDKARDAAIRSVGTIHRSNPNLAITVVTERMLGMGGVTDVRPESDNVVVEKLNADRRAPYGYVVYLDADTYTNADLEAGFAVLEDGWDMVVVPSVAKGEAVLTGVGVAEVAETCAAIGNYEPLRLQGTCIYFRKSAAVHRFFAVWREEWSRNRGPDRAAMLRALKRAPIRVWFFGESYVNGSVVAHHRGTARGK
jgi:hypothetical protein